MHNRSSSFKMAFEPKIAFKLSPTQNEEVREELIFSKMKLHFWYLYAVILEQCSNNPLKLPRVGSIIATIFFESYCKTFPEAFTKCVYKSMLKVDLFLDNNLSVIADMGCFDIAKQIVNDFLKP